MRSWCPPTVYSFSETIKRIWMIFGIEVHTTRCFTLVRYDPIVSVLLITAFGFDLHLGVDWGWSSLALIYNRVRTMARWNFLWSVLLLYDKGMLQLFHRVMSKSWTNNFLSTSMFSQWLNSCWSFCPIIDVAHLPTVVNNDRFLSFPMFVTKVAFFWWSVHIYQYVHISFVIPDHCCQVTSDPSKDVTLFQFQCLTVKVPCHFFTILTYSPTGVQVISYVWRWAEIVHIKFMTYSFYFPIRMCSGHCLCCILACPFPVKFPYNVYMSCCRVCKSLYQSVLCFLGIYCLKITLPLKSTTTSQLNVQMDCYILT